MTKKLNCIMLVDDNPDDNFFHQRVIKRNKSADHVVVCQSAQEAIDYLKNQELDGWIKPDMIFLDINMPGMSGWEFLEVYEDLILSDKNHVIVVMLTTSENPDDIQKADGISHVASYHAKPLSKELLDELISKHFKD
ncbi:response regulator [Reichenbachiella ulvae]|uniref:Response regulator n=1 Tax=Reichenbachiella ulvae TaxID=2980104 RepID=A0ABT3CQE4_9BACT|nr:response regulator [Reichenbachiella ulvae]MCV9385837.1 response regulator [Reichenbachiella ulvae]